MIEFEKDKYGFWRQINPTPIKYDEHYRSIQKTTSEMSWLRIGFMLSLYDVKNILNWNVCDVGSGNGMFAKEASKLFMSPVKEYDLSGETITREELLSTHWDMIFLTDVLEHFLDVDELFEINFDRAFISFPETPNVSDWRMLQDWRHFRPNEHIYCLDLKNMISMCEKNGYKTVLSGNPEDAIRKNKIDQTNISTIIIEKIKA